MCIIHIIYSDSNLGYLIEVNIEQVHEIHAWFTSSGAPQILYHRADVKKSGLLHSI